MTVYWGWQLRLGRWPDSRLGCPLSCILRCIGREPKGQLRNTWSASWAGSQTWHWKVGRCCLRWSWKGEEPPFWLCISSQAFGDEPFLHLEHYSHHSNPGGTMLSWCFRNIMETWRQPAILLADALQTVWQRWRMVESVWHFWSSCASKKSEVEFESCFWEAQEARAACSWEHLCHGSSRPSPTRWRPPPTSSFQDLQPPTSRPSCSSHPNSSSLPTPAISDPSICWWRIVYQAVMVGWWSFLLFYTLCLLENLC